MSIWTRPPTLIIPAYDAAFGPTGTPRIPADTSQIPPMPLHSPGWTPPPTAAQLADPRDPCHCPRHDPASGYFRNTLGFYGSAAPACSGCRRGDQDAIEFALVVAIQRDEARLRELLREDHPVPEVGTVVTRLLTNIADLEAHTTELPTAPDYARRAIAIARTAAALHTAMVLNRPVSALHEAYLAHIATMDRFTRTTFSAAAAAELLIVG